MCHDTKSKFGLVAKKVEIASNDFLVGCLYMIVAQNPTKVALVDKAVKEEDAATRGRIHNITGIISNDVSLGNLVKEIFANGSGNQFNKSIESVLGKNNGTTSNDKPQPKLSSTSNSVTNNTAVRAMVKASVNKTVENSTTKIIESKVTGQLRDAKNLKDAHITNVTQTTKKPKIDLQNKTSMLPAAHKGKIVLQNNYNKIQHLAAGSLASGFATNENQDAMLKQKNLDSGSADGGSAVQHLQNTLQSPFMVAKQPAQLGSQSLNLGKEISLELGKLNQQQKDKNGLHPPIAPNKLPDGKGPKQLNLHFEFPNSPNPEGSTFQQTVNAVPGPALFSLPGQLAQITAKALGFVQNAVKNQQRHKQKQMTPQYSKGGAGVHVSKQQQQQQQQAFHRPLTYFNQQIRPQTNFGAHNFITVPAQGISGRPLAHQFAVKSPVHSPFVYKPAPLFNSAYNYQYPVKGWRGMVSIGKQSLVGNRPKFQVSTEGKQNLQAKPSPKVDNDNKIPDKTGEKNCMCKVGVTSLCDPIP